mmetsp:Transcript_19404/g.43037  ORF Transcript_19404/g.43037 Transcript_19404/m.43037 type:complete len:209 (+) Transcript_19404:984-1610(+)
MQLEYLAGNPFRRHNAFLSRWHCLYFCMHSTPPHSLVFSMALAPGGPSGLASHSPASSACVNSVTASSSPSSSSGASSGLSIMSPMSSPSASSSCSSPSSASSSEAPSESSFSRLSSLVSTSSSVSPGSSTPVSTASPNCSVTPTASESPSTAGSFTIRAAAASAASKKERIAPAHSTRCQASRIGIEGSAAPRSQPADRFPGATLQA